ncbi:MAG: protein kinase [Acidobacteria bacterium]|nr:protein kinase [Acidobacteriota bacterium]
MDSAVSPINNGLLGTVLDEKYRLESKIGAGGFGTVYRATHLGLSQAVAVKILQTSITSPSPEDLTRFRQEGASTCRIKHPNAVTVYDFGMSSSGFAYLVMELLEGHSLVQELNLKGPLTPLRAAEILIPVCDVLAEAHAEGVIHRDIKPDNIFLHQTKRGEVVKVVDFGIAKLIDHTTTSGRQGTPTAGLIGTPAYMAPERLRNRPYDGKADVYSLGITLFQMLTGRLPFEATESGDLAAVILMQVTEEPPWLRDLNPAIPETVEAVVLKALHKNPATRPTPAELAQEFAKAVGVKIQASSGPMLIAGLSTASDFGMLPTTPAHPLIDTEAMTVIAPSTPLELPQTEVILGTPQIQNLETRPNAPAPVRLEDAAGTNLLVSTPSSGAPLETMPLASSAPLVTRPVQKPDTSSPTPTAVDTLVAVANTRRPLAYKLLLALLLLVGGLSIMVYRHFFMGQPTPTPVEIVVPTPPSAPSKPGDIQPGDPTLPEEPLPELDPKEAQGNGHPEFPDPAKPPTPPKTPTSSGSGQSTTERITVRDGDEVITIDTPKDPSAPPKSTSTVKKDSPKLTPEQREQIRQAKEWQIKSKWLEREIKRQMAIEAQKNRKRRPPEQPNN